MESLNTWYNSGELCRRIPETWPDPAIQEPRLIFNRRLFSDPRSPRLRNPNQLRRGERCGTDAAEVGVFVQAWIASAVSAPTMDVLVSAAVALAVAAITLPVVAQANRRGFRFEQAKTGTVA